MVTPPGPGGFAVRAARARKSGNENATWWFLVPSGSKYGARRKHSVGALVVGGGGQCSRPRAGLGRARQTIS